VVQAEWRSVETNLFEQSADAIELPDFQLLWNEKQSGGSGACQLIMALYEQLGLKLAPTKRAVELPVVTATNRQADRSESRVTK